MIDLTADNLIAPDEARIPVGATVVWKVGSGAIHDVTSTSGPESFTSDEQYPKKMKGGDEYERTFTKAGTYQYKCVVHGDMMSGTLRVVEA
jgi:plastocyanin